MISPVSSSLLFALVVAAIMLVSSSNASVMCELEQGCGKAKAVVQQSTGNETTSTVNVHPDLLVHGHEEEEEEEEADVVLKQRIQFLRDYLANPIQHLEQMDLAFKLQDEDGEPISSNTQTIVAVLEALEDEFSSDSEMTLEFYSQGGWPLLASLVSRDVHQSNNNAKELGDKMLVVRTHAAWTMGTAVKNIPEFHSWVLEEQIMDNSGVVNTPLNLVVQALAEVSDAAVEPGSCTKTTMEYQEQLAQQAIYALESFLNGNPQAQVVFSSMSNAPAQSLGTQAAQWAQEAATTAAEISSNAPMSRHAIKMTTRLLSLANDIVKDVQMHDHNEQDSQAIVDVFSTNDWCHAANLAATFPTSSNFKRLVFKALQKTAKQTVTTLGSHCSVAEVPSIETM